MTVERDNAANDIVVDSSGSVFDDLDIKLSTDDLLKIEISRAIAATLRRRGLTQKAAAEILGVDQPKISALLRGRLSAFSVDRLIRYLVALGKDIDIRISGDSVDKPGRVKVVQAA